MLRIIAISKKQHKNNNNTNNMSFTPYMEPYRIVLLVFTSNFDNHLLPKGAIIIMCYEQMALVLTLTLCIICPSSATRARPYQFIFSLPSKGFWWSGKFNWISYLGLHNFKMWFVKYCLHCVNYRAFKEFEFQIWKHHNTYKKVEID